MQALSIWALRSRSEEGLVLNSVDRSIGWLALPMCAPLLSGYASSVAAADGTGSAAPVNVHEAFVVDEHPVPDIFRRGSAVDAPTTIPTLLDGTQFTAYTDASPDRGSIAVTPRESTKMPEVKEEAEQQSSLFRWPTYDESRFVARGQMTYVWQRKFGFHADYTGPQSLVTTPESTYTLSFTGYLGARAPWEGGELYVDPEAFQAHPLSNLLGLASVQNGELQKASGAEIRAYLARAFVRQTFELGGETREVPAGFNQLATHYDSRRLVFTVGKSPLTDFFSHNSYATDPRTQFMNWSLITYGAYDYAADARGYNIGGVVELDWDNWAFRAGRGMEPTIANGRSLHYNLLRRHGDQVEIQHDHEVHGQPGSVSVLVYRNVANAGNYAQAVALAATTGTIPDITAHRYLEAKTGYGVSVEQSLSSAVGVWGRGMWCDCKVEEYAFTEIDNMISAGVSLKGSIWHRAEDTVGAAFSLNGLSPEHRAYLAAGGLGGFLGDGQLNYGKEQTYEIYYSALVYRGVHLTFDYQRVVNPGYNADRHGPVNLLGGRMHVEF
jgi:high affinity Mn2+ porin